MKIKKSKRKRTEEKKVNEKRENGEGIKSRKERNFIGKK